MNKKRNVYLKMKTLTEAREIILNEFNTTGQWVKETIAVPDAVGRVLAGPVHARLSAPHFHAAAMDGIAVKASDTFGASEAQPKQLLTGKGAYWVNTGHVLPDNTDAVIMVEHIHVIDEATIEIDSPAFPWQHIRKIGEDIVATELLFPQNHLITPYCLGALLSGGVFSVTVKKKPKILIIPTGSELVDWQQMEDKSLQPGQILDSNSYVLGSLATSAGAIVVRHERLMDDLATLTEKVRLAAHSDADIILTVGGSSAGSEDYSKDVIEALGDILVHGVTIMPGKPVIVGNINHKPIFGIPGYPVSAIIAFEQFVQPLIDQFLGQPEKIRQTVSVEPTRKIASKLGLEEFIRVKLGLVGNRIVATPLPRGAGCITSITEADGIIRVPSHVEGIKDNDDVSAELLRPISAIQNTLVAVGSHDNSLDVLADQLKAEKSMLTLSSSHVGSMGGLMAVKKGVCHMAGSHLLDTEDGSYNIRYLKKYLPDTDVRLVNLVFRDQGFIVPKGNPKHINGIEDICREDVRFINRQGGSGTRILLDYRLEQSGLDADMIHGYEIEEFTHMSVAVAVLSGTVDVGLGIYAAAKALDLDFIPMVTEQYDLVIPQIFIDMKQMQILLDIINSGVFKRRVEALGGYSTIKTGTIIL
ncbi:MAG: molybdopterin biosynthesis protein [Deltaproteobacteria bacterium]|nr:MAG: molybdopterin biosynthesis protein [Deltaproteobacteria bacterium]RLC17799.1 MAG: molybdopterin biosynthesis protein [Deltaproteobacteria bacterium]